MTVALLIVASAMIVRLQANVLPEEAAIPSPRIPSPNARDYFNSAERIAHVGAALESAASLPLPITNASEAKQAEDPASPYHVFTLTEKGKLVAENSRAIALLRQGMRFPYLSPPIRSFSALEPEYLNDRSMARLLLLEGNTKAEHGDWSDAMGSYIDAINLGADLAHGGKVRTLLLSIACQAIGRRPAETAMDHLSAIQAESDARRLAAIDADQEPYSQTLQEEEWSFQASLLELFRSPRWRETWCFRTVAAYRLGGGIAEARLQLLYRLPRCVDRAR